jgi:hypothetical protein
MMWLGWLSWPSRPDAHAVTTSRHRAVVGSCNSNPVPLSDLLLWANYRPARVRDKPMNKMASILLGCFAATLPGHSDAATLTLGTAAVQKLVAERLFSEQGRWYLLNGTCYAYLESPRTSLAQGRIVIEAHLSSQLGVEMSGSCVGSGFNSKVVMSGRLVGAGSTLTLTEIRFDRVEDDATRSALNLLQSVAPTTLPPFDVLAAIRARPVKPDELPITVDTLQIDGVTTSDKAITVRFDFALRAP